ncbi:hypothetical protein [Luteimonas mephitis]|jgi:hypothetical protein|uniref:hypothetical protein n=1 Tax=Luteimonas mephitis TaxID=83615 RepID=UPI00041B5B2E|nr:hypothetical protein [Luteimonas mephitis]
MNESKGYAVFFFPQALEILGDAIKPYLQDSPAGAHVPCNEIDTGGALVEMTLHGRDAGNRDVALELMVPVSMVRMVVSTRSDEGFGFGPQVVARPEPVVAKGALEAEPKSVPASPSSPAPTPSSPETPGTSEGVEPSRA